MNVPENSSVGVADEVAANWRASATYAFRTDLAPTVRIFAVPADQDADVTLQDAERVSAISHTTP